MRSIVRLALIGWCALVCACHSSSDDPPQQPAPPPPGSPPVGLDARPSNATCVAPAKASGNAGATIALQRAFPNLTFTQPLAMLQAPGDDSRWFVLEKTGSVRVFANTPNVSTASTFATLTVNSNSEGGLLGMAFHPNFASNGQVFLSTTEGSPMVSVIARYTVNAGGATLDTVNPQVILRLNQPFDNHKGGNIAFGPDGFLYIGFGDGGSGGDPQGHAQNTTDMLGDMLRIDVNGAAPYAIPPDNPFAGQNLPLCSAGTNAHVCPEIYASGLRNPWRWSFDKGTGELWVGDVGQNKFEEIDRVARGGNYGWNCREGLSAYTDSPPAAICATLPAATFTNPVHAYGRTDGISVTGGYVYRGTALPGLVGRYLFADYGSGKIWRLVGNGSGGFTAQELLDTTLSISSFGQGNDGELYVIDIAGGTLQKIVDGGGAAPPGPPVASQLSATGCVSPANPSQAAAGMIPYDVAASFWSDGATKERWLAIPDGTTIGVGADGDFSFPNGTVLMKHFRLNGNLVETRLFMRHPDGDWAGYSYEWNAQHTDATLLAGSKSVTIGGTVNWFFPSGNDCMTCHTSVAGFALGVEAAQLNHDFLYASTARTANELRTLDHILMFPTPLGDPAAQPKMPDPFDATAPLGDRARAYLHTNCAQCHRPNGPTPVSMDFRYSTALASTSACDVVPTAGDFGLTNARIIAPGAPDRSVLVARVDRRDASQMPPLASTVKDAAGITLLRDWITSLATCQ
ncbi:MAG TPA: PQQ-dependent sugar dehydrogenase [Gammaproteobacteria bacterium]|nr:PQQ-dependent sugar dehydrogenase [Gammaproteobacteria bacterium]